MRSGSLRTTIGKGGLRLASFCQMAVGPSPSYWLQPPSTSKVSLALIGTRKCLKQIALISWLARRCGATRGSSQLRYAGCCGLGGSSSDSAPPSAG